MYLKAEQYPKYNEAVRDIQEKLNAIRIRVHGNWDSLTPDGLFGSKTKEAVISFQKYRNIMPAKGEVGDTTLKYINEEYGRIPILKANNPIITNPRYGTKTYPNAKSINDVKRMELGKSICDAISIWNQAYNPANSIVWFLGQGFIVLSEKLFKYNRNLSLHLCLNQINECFHNHKGKGFDWKWIKISRQGGYTGFRAYRAFKMSEIVGGTMSNVSTHLSAVGCVIDTVDTAGKIMKGEFKFLDWDNAKLAFNYASTAMDYALKDVNTIRMSVGKAVKSYGKAMVKWKFVAKITGKSVARAGVVAVSSGCVVVGIQCASAIMVGCELGKWIENKWHIGETAVNFYWELFLGDIVEKFIEWNTNRIVCIKYPEDWTDTQIQEFQSKFK